MKLRAGHHLAYSTNVHPGETWSETLSALEQFTLPVRAAIAPNESFGIGLRLSDQASRELVEPGVLDQFCQWLETHNCYVFTINGFPFGKFHGGRVKEQVYLPDWTTKERLDYTNRLFDILAALLPNDVEGSVSTVPGSFKEFIAGDDQVEAIRRNLRQCDEHISGLSESYGCKLHLGLEPEPLGLFENTEETLRFFEALPNEHLGVNYDACHFAVEYKIRSKAWARFIPPAFGSASCISVQRCVACQRERPLRGCALSRTTFTCTRSSPGHHMANCMVTKICRLPSRPTTWQKNGASIFTSRSTRS